MEGLIFKNKKSLIYEKDFPGYDIISLDNMDYQELDDWMHNLVLGVIGQKKNIFIPLSFGAIMSDFLGLRLAMHIRTTLTGCQLSNIFLYGTEAFASVMDDDFSLILRTTSVFLIDYNLSTMQLHAGKFNPILNKSDLIAELDKIQLKVPTNLYDRHSVANIWGMYRLLELEGIAPSEIKSLVSQKNKLNNIYFKWLTAKNMRIELVNEEVMGAKESYANKLAGLKIIGKIDLSKIK
jgi:hypothetical protein